MPVGSAWYVRAVQLGFPYGYQWLDGPHDNVQAVIDRRDAIDKAGAGAALQATIGYALRRGKTLPELRYRDKPVPLPGHNLRNRPGREAAARDLAQRAEALGATVVVENWDGEPDVDITLPGLRATIWLAWTPQAPMPIISWYGAVHPLRGVPGAWTDEAVNSAHRRKATSLPASWPELFDMLEAGICAAVDGSAFELEGGS